MRDFDKIRSLRDDDRKSDPSFRLKLRNDPLFDGPYYQGYCNTKHNNGISLRIIRNDHSAPIYTPELAVILQTREIKAYNEYKNCIDFVDGTTFINSFMKGFVEGEKYFKENYGTSGDHLYGINSEEYIRELHDQYYHKGRRNRLSGWVYAKRSFPVIIRHKTIAEYGYYTGIIDCVEVLKYNHTHLFNKYFFDRCLENGEPVPENRISANLEQFANMFIPGMKMIIAIEHFYKLIKEKSKRNKKPFLNDEQFENFIKRAFLEESTIEKQTLNVNKGEKGFIIKLFHSFYQLSYEYDSIHHNTKTYIKLLTNNFTNWTFDEVKNNFKDTVARSW